MLTFVNWHASVLHDLDKTSLIQGNATHIVLVSQGTRPYEGMIESYEELHFGEQHNGKDFGFNKWMLWYRRGGSFVCVSTFVSYKRLSVPLYPIISISLSSDQDYLVFMFKGKLISLSWSYLESILII